MNENDVQVESQEEEKFLTAEEILSKDDIDWMSISVKEWGGKICCVAMTGDEAIQFYKDFNDPEKKDSAIIRLFVLSVVNNPTDRKKIFNEAKVERLRKHKYGIFLQVQDKLLIFNGMKKEAAATAKNG